MSQIASLPSNQSLFTDNPLVNFTSEATQDLPRWLLEFDSFARDDNSKSDCKQTRPLTESHLCNRPKWFEELSQRRRLSEIPGMETDEAAAELASTLQFDDHISKTSYTDISKTDLSEQENKAKLPTENKYSSEWLFLVQNGDSTGKPSHSGNSSSDGSKHSFLADADYLEENIFSLSTSRSIEKLRISELMTPLEECIIPEMPRGSEIILSLLSNWGDEHFIGINGIEVLDPLGKRPVVKNIYLQDTANKRHQSVDLRKLVDNIYRTHDDNHIWQHRVAAREQLPLQIVIQLQEPITIALLRIWNYNKSRIHSYRGVKFLQIKLSGQLIFSGEIAKASGELNGSVENFGDTILFTTSESILENISNFDTSFQELLMEQFQQVPLKF